MDEWLNSLCAHKSANFAVFVLLLNSFFLGHIFFKIAGIKFRRPFFSALSCLAIGIDFFVLISYLYGLFGYFRFPYLKYLMILSAFFSVIYIFKENYGKFYLLIKNLRKERLFLFVLCVCGLFFWGNTFCLPIVWDELSYQLAVPLRWLNDGKITFYPDNPYSGFPSAGNFLYLLLIYLGGLSAPRVFVWFLWMLSIICVYGFLRPGLSRFYSLALAFSFGLSYVALMCGSSAYVEMIIIFHFSASLAIIKEKNWYPDLKRCMILGILCGIASSIKLTGLIIGFSFLLFLFIACFIIRTVSVKGLSAYLFACVAIMLLFYFRPYLETGNPFYPYFGSFFSNSLNEIETGKYHHLIGSEKYGIGGISGFLYSLFLLGLPINTFDGNFGYQFLIILFFVFISLFLLLKAQKWEIAFLNYYFPFIFYVFWFFTSRQARFFILVAFTFALASKPYLVHKSRIKSVLIAFSIFCIIWSFPTILWEYFSSSWKVLTGKMRQVDFVYSGTGEGFLQAMDMVRTKTPQNAKFIMLFENRGLYMPRKYVIGTPFFQSKYFTPPEAFEDEYKIIESIKKNNITHILVGLSYKDPDRLSAYINRSLGFSKAIGNLIEKNQISPLWESSYYAIYAVK